MKGEQGRPTKYKSEYDEQVVKLCRLGATDKEIADFFNVCEATINLWKIKEPTFSESIKTGKQIADMQVTEALFKRATGYEQETVKVFQFQGEPVIVPVVEKIQPDTTAQIFWLKNRQSAKWRDKQDIGVTGSLGVKIVDDIE